MTDGEKVDAYIARTLTLVNKLKMNGGEDMSQVDIVEKILRSLTPRFDYVVCSIEESNDLDSMTLDELQSSLLVHEQRLNRISGSSREEQALKITHGERSSRGRGRGPFRGRGCGRGRGFFNKETIECYNCHKLGHFQYECPNWEKNANYVEVDESEEMLLMTYAEVNRSKGDVEYLDSGISEEMLVLMTSAEMNQSASDVWYLDSGCSNHMSGDKQWFINLDESFKHTVKLGNDTYMSVMGIGNIKVQVQQTIQVITEVYYIPELKTNLFSLGQFQEKKLAILIKDDMCKKFHPTKGLIMQTSMSTNRMFVLRASVPVRADCLQMTSSENTHTLVA